MPQTAHRALLPAGLRDILPPAAAWEAELVQRLTGIFAVHGYDRVKPPLIEFEDSLLQGAGASMARTSFRLMDPVSQKMMCVRPDMTVQVARIATTRLKQAPRPLRLSYAGPVLHVKGTQLRPERQFTQAGIELIGAESAAADAEVIVLAARALRVLGVEGLSFDLTLPSLVALALAGMDADGDLRHALDHKDVAAVASLGGEKAALLGALIAAVGPADRALQRLAALDLPAAAAVERARLATVVALVRAELPDLTLTIDPVENRGYDYHAGIAFTIFARAAGGEIGRGGRYRADGEPAVGASLFLDTVMDVLPEPVSGPSLFIPAGSAPELGRDWRAAGNRAIAGLEEVADPVAEARRLGCSHVILNGAIAPLV